jgi:uncharacterized protein YneR
MTVNYSGEVEADTEEDAVSYFIEKREYMYFESVEDETVEEIEEEDDDA